MADKRIVITISRQFGSLGREIGKRLAHALGVKYYDREMIEQTAERMHIEAAALSKYDESSTGRFSRMIHPLGLGQTTTHKRVFQYQRSMILNIASNESCVIVGRCADYILQDDPNAFHIFIYAPYKARLRNAVAELGLDEGYAVKMIKEVDEARNVYHKYYTGEDEDSIKYRNICIDSSIMNIDDTVRYLKDIILTHYGLS